jgi:transposase
MSARVDPPPCPRCGQPLSVTSTTAEPGEQLAVGRIECPNCGAHLARDVEGHADRGWRLDEEGSG